MPLTPTVAPGMEHIDIYASSSSSSLSSTRLLQTSLPAKRQKVEDDTISAPSSPDMARDKPHPGSSLSNQDNSGDNPPNEKQKSSTIEILSSSPVNDRVNSVQLPFSVRQNNHSIFSDIANLNQEEYKQYIMKFARCTDTQYKTFFPENESKNFVVMIVAADDLSIDDFDRFFSANKMYTDRNINMYILHVLVPRQTFLYCNTPHYKPWFYVSCYFIFDLLREESDNVEERGIYQYKNYLKRKDLTNARGIVIPYNKNRNHWVLYVVEFESTTITLVDSMASNRQKYVESANVQFDAVRQYLIDRKNLYPTLTPNFDDNGWKYKFTDMMNTTQQSDRVSCGVFCCMYADMLQLNHPLTFPVGLQHWYRNYVTRQILNFWDTPVQDTIAID